MSRLADRFAIRSLKDILDSHLSLAVTETNILEIFVHADLVDLKKAYSTTAALIDRKPSHILGNPKLLSLESHHLQQILSRSSFVIAERYVFQAIQRWMQHNNKTPAEAADVLRCVRLCEITPEYLFSDVEPSGLFEESAIIEAVRVRCKPQWDSTQPRGLKPGLIHCMHDGISLVPRFPTCAKEIGNKRRGKPGRIYHICMACTP